MTPDPTAVVWTFSGMSLAEVFDFNTNNPIQSDTGQLLAGSTISFDASGNVTDFHITTIGGAFGFTYQYGVNSYATPATNTNVPGAWEFQTGDSLLEIMLLGDITGSAASGATVAVDPNNTFEYALSTAFPDSPNGVYRLAAVGGMLTATTVTSVPEPASMALFGVGLLGLGAVVRRRSQPAA